MTEKLKVDACIYPDTKGCRECKYNEVPGLYDGGCKLQRRVEMTEAAKEKRKEYKREWNRKNKDKVKAAQERYWNRKAAAEPEQQTREA